MPPKTFRPKSMKEFLDGITTRVSLDKLQSKNNLKFISKFR